MERIRVRAGSLSGESGLAGEGMESDSSWGPVEGGMEALSRQGFVLLSCNAMSPVPRTLPGTQLVLSKYLLSKQVNC